MFLGSLIKMNCIDTSQHSLPHFHGYTREFEIDSVFKEINF